MSVRTAAFLGLALAAAQPAAAAQTVFTESFDTDFAGWKSRWFGANSNARPLFFDPADRGTNLTGLSIADGDFGPDGAYNGSRVDIRFDRDFGASLVSFAFDILSYNGQTLEFYDMAGRTIVSQALAVTPFDAANLFAQSDYTRFTVTSANGIAGFSLLPFGAEGNVSLDNLAATVAAVPEPATWLSMIAGFGLVGGALRRRSALRTA